MNIIQAEWYDASEVLPAHIDWVIVRCINSDEDTDFYFMALYCKDGSWDFFSSDDKDYENTMQVTHWMNAPNIEFNRAFNKRNNHGTVSG